MQPLDKDIFPILIWFLHLYEAVNLIMFWNGQVSQKTAQISHIRTSSLWKFEKFSWTEWFLMSQIYCEIPVTD